MTLPRELISAWFKQTLMLHNYSYRAFSAACYDAGLPLGPDAISNIANNKRQLMLYEFMIMCHVLQIEPTTALTTIMSMSTDNEPNAR